MSDRSPIQPDARRPVVVALGGNALSPIGGSGSLEEQFAETARTTRVLADLAEAGHRLVVTHGNGPQVGSALRRVELAAHEVYPLSLDICVADLQGGMGYMIAQCLNNELKQRGHAGIATAVVTTVEVDPEDNAFVNPTKPIGPVYDAARAQEYIDTLGWQMVDIPNRGMRRLVPSPVPLRICELDIVRTLIDAGQLVITAGGGGVPVVARDGRYAGVEAVIDKDRASGLLASELNASAFVIVTGVEQVMLGFGTDNESAFTTLTTGDARRHLADGEFPPGSMGPKIDAAVQFIENQTNGERTPGRVIISNVDRMADAIAGNAGTEIVSGD